MRWKTLGKSDCINAVSTLPLSFSADELDAEYAELRSDLLEISRTIFAEKPDAKEYLYDVSLAVPLYRLLTTKYGMAERHASNDGIWRYISIKVVPDLVLKRWGYKDARFWKESRRIWLKALWWYVHLSWQGDSLSTQKILAANTTDILVQLVERPGPQGYRVSVCREIMKKLAAIPSVKNRAVLFRKIMVLNTARLKVVEPALCNEGEEGYVRQLFAYFGIK